MLRIMPPPDRQTRHRPTMRRTTPPVRHRPPSRRVSPARPCRPNRPPQCLPTTTSSRPRRPMPPRATRPHPKPPMNVAMSPQRPCRGEIRRRRRLSSPPERRRVPPERVRHPTADRWLMPPKRTSTRGSRQPPVRRPRHLSGPTNRYPRHLSRPTNRHPRATPETRPPSPVLPSGLRERSTQEKRSNRQRSPPTARSLSGPPAQRVRMPRWPNRMPLGRPCGRSRRWTG